MFGPEKEQVSSLEYNATKNFVLY